MGHRVRVRVYCSRGKLPTQPKPAAVARDAATTEAGLPPSKRRRRTSLRVQCPWVITAQSRDNTLWTVTAFTNNHANGCNPSPAQAVLTRKKRPTPIPEGVFEGLCGMVEDGTLSTAQIRAYLTDKACGVRLDSQSVANIKSRVIAHVVSGGCVIHFNANVYE